MLSIDDFKAVKIDDKNIFDKHYQKYPPVHSDNVFTTIISWMKYSNYHYLIKNNNLIIYSNINNQIRFRPPSGKRDKGLFDQVIQLAKKQDSDYPFGVIDLETKEWMEKNYKNFDFKEHRDYFDYVYSASDLAELSGSKYSKIRNRLNKFKKKYSYSLEFVSETNMKEVKDFLDRWCLWKDCESDIILENEKKAILYSMANFFELGLSGLIMRINNKIEALSVFEKMNNDTAIVHYEKASPDFDGIYKAINQETAKRLQKEFKFINRESDMGIPGLRQAKISYRPHHMIEVFHIKKENLSF